MIRYGFYAGLKDNKIVDLYTGEVFFVDGSNNVTLLSERFIPKTTLEDEIQAIINDTQCDERLLPLFCGIKEYYSGYIVNFDGTKGIWEF